MSVTINNLVFSLLGSWGWGHHILSLPAGLQQRTLRLLLSGEIHLHSLVMKYKATKESGFNYTMQICFTIDWFHEMGEVGLNRAQETVDVSVSRTNIVLHYPFTFIYFIYLLHLLYSALLPLLLWLNKQ